MFWPRGPASDREILIERTFEAPRELVFRAWTDGAHLRQWCCPAGFTIPHAEGPVRPGGRFRTCMRAADGTDYWLSGTYLEIVPPERLSFIHAWDDEPAMGPETTVTVRLEDAGPGRTKLTLHQALFDGAAYRDVHATGWHESFDKLATLLD